MAAAIPNVSSVGNSPIGLNKLSLNPSAAATFNPCLAVRRFPATVVGSRDHQASKLACLISFKSLTSCGRLWIGSLLIKFRKWHKSHWKGVHQVISIQPNYISSLIFQSGHNHTILIHGLSNGELLII
jgi:hypothetical protein